MAVFLNQDAWDKFRLSKEEYELQKELDEKKKEDEEKAEEDEDGDGDEDANSEDEESEDGDDEGDGEDGEEDEDEVEPIEVELDGLDDRKARLTIHSSDLGGYALSPEGDKLYYLARFEKGYDLWVRDFREESTKILASQRGLGGDGVER